MPDSVPTPPENSANLPQRLDTPGGLAEQMQQPWSQLGPEHEAEKGTDFRRYLAAVLRYKWLILLCVVLGTGAGFGASRIINPLYSAQATIWIETEETRGGAMQQSQLLSGASWIELLRAFRVMDYSVEQMRLYLSYGSPADSTIFQNFDLKERFATGPFVLSVNASGDQLTLRTADGIVIETVSPGDSLGGSTLGFTWAPPATAFRPGQEITFSVSRPRDAAVDLRERMLPMLDRNGSILRVMLSGTDPDRTAVTLNTVVQRFVDVAAQLKRDNLTEAAIIIGERLQLANAQLQAAENALESYRVRTITLPRDQAGPVTAGLESTREDVFTQFFDMRVELDQLYRDRDAIDRAMASAVDSGMSINALEVIGTVQQSTEVMQALNELGEMRAELRVLQRNYTEEHPVVVDLAEDVTDVEQTAIPALLNRLLAQVDTRRQVLEGRIESASGELREIPTRVIEEEGLRRDLEGAENLYTTLQSAHEAARLAEESSIPDVRILDDAVVSTRAVSNRAPTVMLIGIAAGFGLGLLCAILLDRIDRRVRYPEQVTTELGLQLLGVVPHLKGGGNGKGAEDAAPIVEALRGIRLSLVHACGSASPLIVTITSPGPGDGKSFVASNLSLAFADAGHRTVLVDADARRGTLHRVLNANRKPGLTDFLDGKVGRSEIVQDTAYPSLSFIGCGTRTPSAPELIGSAAMTQLMTGLRSIYSVIIVDSPPLGAGVDAFALGTLTGNMMVILRLGQTDRELAEAKLDVLDRLPVRLIGAVLNDVREGAATQYYKYYSYYMPGYEAGDEEGGSPRALIGSKDG